MDKDWLSWSEGGLFSLFAVSINEDFTDEAIKRENEEETTP